MLYYTKSQSKFKYLFNMNSYQNNIYLLIVKINSPVVLAFPGLYAE